MAYQPNSNPAGVIAARKLAKAYCIDGPLAGTTRKLIGGIIPLYISFPKYKDGILLNGAIVYCHIKSIFENGTYKEIYQFSHYSKTRRG